MPEYSLMFISLIDPLHNGAAEGMGWIDRPIVRERTTAFPIIQPGSLKGVLRNAFDSKLLEKEKVIALFGPEPQHGESHEGAISFGEGQLLAFPIRSLKGNFVWATSPHVLYRFQTKTSIGGFAMLGLEPLLKKVQPLPKPLICDGSEGIVSIGSPPRLVLEEFVYKYQQSRELKQFAAEIAAKIFDTSHYLCKEFEKKLIVLPDDAFKYFVSNATEIMPNIRIGANGTTEEGSLRYTEYVPRETLFYSLVIYEKGKVPSKKSRYNYDIRALGVDEAKKVKNIFDANLPTRIQVGGDETTGKGMIALKIVG